MPDKSSHHICPYASALSDDEEGSIAHDPLSSPTEGALSLARSKCPAFADNSCPFRGATNPESLRDIMKTVPPSHFPSSSSALQKIIVGQQKQQQQQHQQSQQAVSGGNSSSGTGGGGSDAASTTPTAFQLAMEHIHKVSNYLRSASAGRESNTAHVENATLSSQERETNPHINRDVFIIQGGCPFKSFHQDHPTSSSSTTLARAMEEYSLAAIMGRMASFSEDGYNENDEEEDYDENELENEESEQTNSITAPKLATSQTDTTISESRQSLEKSLRPEQSSLSHALKTGTAESHTSAENVHFVKNFIKGIIDRELYMELVSGLYHTYVTLEKLLNQHGPTHFPSLHFPKELSRTEALKEDMEFWHGIGWASKPECRVPSPTVREYIERMEEVGRIDPLLLLSHAYTRYLGDLSGGKVLSRIARRALNLSEYNGLQFYQFESIPSAKLFKDKYRTALDELVLRRDQIGRLVAEANVAFALNMRVFEELDVLGGVPGARVRDVREALVYYDREIEEQNGTRERDTNKFDEEAKCPFGFVGPNPHASSADKKTEDLSTSSTMKDQSVFTSTEQGANLKEMNKTSGGRCPWPFVFFHDPMMGMRDWQTWFVVGLALCWCWSRLNAALPN